MRETPKGGSFSHGVPRPQAGLAGFLSTDYVVNAQGRLRPVEGIDRCAQAVEGICAISKHAWRRRKTGPSFPLRILKCGTHACYFTVYPLGFTPYARQPLTPLGSTMRAAADESAAVSSRWNRTVFEAAIRAAEGELGLRDVVHGDPVEPRYATGRRRTQRAGLLLGLAAQTDERMAEVVAQSLGLLGLDHQAGRQAFSNAHARRGQGAAVVSMLQVLPTAGALETRLLGAGFLVGLWGRPALWDARTSRRTFPPFAAPVLPARGPP